MRPGEWQGGSQVWRERPRRISEQEKGPPPLPLTAAWAQAPPPNRSPAWGVAQAQSSAGLTPFLWGLATCQEETRA